MADCPIITAENGRLCFLYSAETKELVAGYWPWEVQSMQEAIDWVKRCPNPMNGDSDIEIRPVFEPEDFGEAFTPELQEDWKRIQAESEKLATK
jgi:hypothetical protein